MRRLSPRIDLGWQQLLKINFKPNQMCMGSKSIWRLFRKYWSRNWIRCHWISTHIQGSIPKHIDGYRYGWQFLWRRSIVTWTFRWSFSKAIRSARRLLHQGDVISKVIWSCYFHQQGDMINEARRFYQQGELIAKPIWSARQSDQQGDMISKANWSSRWNFSKVISSARRI